MIGFDVKQAKALFFTAEAVIKATDKATRRALSRFGAFVRSDARRSIRRRKGLGKTPTNRTGILKKFIFFAYEPIQGNVVIGPVKLRGNSNRDGALEALEHGGTFRRRIPLGKGREGKHKTVMAHYKARPYMQPAFEKNKPKINEIWRNAITR